MAGERVKKAGYRHAVCVNHEVGNQSLDDRCRGFKDGMGVDVPVLQGVLDPTELKGRILAYISKNKNTDFVLTLGPVAADTTLAAFDELGAVGKIGAGTFDLSPNVLKAVKAGHMEFAIDAQQYLMGYMPVVMFDLMKKYKLEPIADYPTGPGFVTKETASSVIELSKRGIR